MKILLDANMSPKWTAVLVAGGHDAIHWGSVGILSAPDEELMRFCVSESRLLVTHDLDFGRILARSREGRPSVLQIRTGDPRVTTWSGPVLLVLQNYQKEIEAGAFVTLDDGKTRIRLLPFDRDGVNE